MIQVAWNMQASIKSGFGLQNRWPFLGVSDYGKKDSAFSGIQTRLPMSKQTSCFGFRISSASLGVKGSADSVFVSSTKFRSVRAQASEGDVEDVSPVKIHVKSSGSVLPYVGVACLGAILFGYHLGVVNGALEYLAKDLGIAENAVLKGKLCLT
ncbi:uncharacterized protein [Primulina huaijiensis]|uniref:uncharacterized protein n=1 Tax=Primulina huaijiensis TaxID=1492673 RepID=UPI003CC76CD0